jgi:valyl-tRNA synthetase
VPFVTEEMWEKIPHEGSSLAVSPYPSSDPSTRDDGAERKIAFLVEAVTAIRNARAEAAIKPAERVACVMVAPAATREALIEPTREYLTALARLGSLDILTSRPPGGTPKAIVGDVEIHVSAPAKETTASDLARLRSELTGLLAEVEPWAAKLGNPQFVERAKPDVVEKARRIHRELTEKIDRIRQNLAGGAA